MRDEWLQSLRGRQSLSCKVIEDEGERKVNVKVNKRGIKTYSSQGKRLPRDKDSKSCNLRKVEWLRGYEAGYLV